MRILHVIPSIDPSYGGPVEGIRQFCNIYHSGGHQVEIATMDSPEAVEGISFPARVIALGPGWGIYRYSFHAIPWLKANRARFDIVVVNCLWQYNAVAAHRALAGTGIPYIVFAHGMLDPYFKNRFPLKHFKKVLYWRGVLQKILQDAHSVCFTCEDEKILARQSFSHYKANETVVPYGTFGPDAAMDNAAEDFLAQWPHLRGKRVALTLGRVHPKKALDVLIQAFGETLAKDSAWHLVIAGPDEIGWRRDLEKLATDLGISDRITWTGMLKGKLKWGAFMASEIFALPSHQENFGIVVAEALSCSLPVILSKKVNIWREIVNCGAGFANEDTVEGTKASLRLWSALDSAEMSAMRTQSKKCFDEFFNFTVTSRKLLDIVERVAQSNPRFGASSPDEAGEGNHGVQPI
jgi:glycosyltransferase involved in cell wall biosynthesis